MDASEGIFRQISKSEPIVDVGMTTILKIANSGTTIYALSSKGGLVRYDVVTKQPVRLDGESPISQVLVGSNGTDIMYTVYNGTTWYKLDDSDNPIAQNLPPRQVITTSLYGGWELSRGTASGSFDLYHDLTTKVVADLHNTFAAYPWLIAQDTKEAGGIVLVTGLAADSTSNNIKYSHVLYDSSGNFTTITPSINNPIVAFAYDKNSEKLVAITSDGKVYGGTKSESGTTFIMAAGDTTLSFLPNGITGKPIPSFIDSTGNLVIQGSSLFYSISPAKVVTQIQDSYAPSLRSSTFKITSMILDGTDFYGGTAKNGIFKVDLTDDSVDWL
jgi:hypothetical protein